MKLALLAALLATPSQPSVAELDAERLELERAGMWTLGGWAVANIVTGVVGHFTSEGEWQAFHQANAVWNTVNLTIAAVSLARTPPSDPPTLERALRTAHGLDRVLLLNAGLDVAYIAAGAFLWERGERVKSGRQLGIGRSLVLQGAFLLAFDVTLVLLQRPYLEAFYLRMDEEDGAHAGVSLRW